MALTAGRRACTASEPFVSPSGLVSRLRKPSGSTSDQPLHTQYYASSFRATLGLHPPGYTSFKLAPMDLFDHIRHCYGEKESGRPTHVSNLLPGHIKLWLEASPSHCASTQLMTLLKMDYKSTRIDHAQKRQRISVSQWHVTILSFFAGDISTGDCEHTPSCFRRILRFVTTQIFRT